MILTKISLLNFRNYYKMNINFGSKMNILIGENAQGKTNVLEAITILALTKSHRVGINPNLIKFNKEKAIIKGRVKVNRIINDLEIELTSSQKKIKVNNNGIGRLADYISYLNVIVFTPDDLEILKGSPSTRRNFLNIELSQLSKTYLNTYNEYNKILKTRNEYLKLLFTSSIADKAYLDILTEKLIDKSIIIYKERYKFINKLNEELSNIYFDISKQQNLKIVYEPNIEFKSYNDDDIRDKMFQIYNKYYEKELNYKMTLYGPHRDDFTYILKDIDLKYFGSQGQQRLAIISTKLAEINIFKEVCNTTPILLLDDIFSELDLNKRKQLLKYINNDIQSIITTTDLKNISKRYLDDSNIYVVKEGKIERK